MAKKDGGKKTTGSAKKQSNSRQSRLQSAASTTGKVVSKSFAPVRNKIVSEVDGVNYFGDVLTGVKKKSSITKTVSKAISPVKTRLASELPDLVNFASGFSSIFEDFKKQQQKQNKNLSSDPKAQTDPTQKNIDKNIQQIKTESVDQTSLFQELINWMKNIDSNLHGSPPYLLSIKNEAEQINTEITTLTQVMGSVLGVNQDQLELTRKIMKFDKERDKKSKFVNQKAQSKVAFDHTQPTSEVNEQKRHDELLDYLKTSFITKMILGLETLLIPVIGLFGKVGGVGKLPGAISKSFKAMSGVGMGAKMSGIGGMMMGGLGKIAGPLGGLMKGVGKFAWFFTILEGAFGAIKRGLTAYLSGADASKIIEEIVRGAIFTPLQSFADLAEYLTGIKMPNIEEEFDKFYQAPLDYILNVTDMFTKWAGKKLREGSKWAFKKVSDSIKSMTEWTSNLFFDFVDYIGKKLTEAFEYIKSSFVNSIKGMLNYIVDMSGTRSFLTESQQQFLKPEDQSQQSITEKLTPSSKANRMASVLYKDQQAITEFENARMFGPQQYGNQPSFLSAPVTTNIQTNNVFTGNIHTRNPDSLVFIKNTNKALSY